MIFALVAIFLIFSVPVDTVETETEVLPLSAPETINEAIRYIDRLIPNKEVAIIRRTSENEFASNAVNTLGVYMISEWRLYSPESPLGSFFMRNEIFDPNEMAEIILIAYWRRLNAKDADIDRILLERLRYWDSLRSGN